jgi:hypothetical protein
LAGVGLLHLHDRSGKQASKQCAEETKDGTPHVAPVRHLIFFLTFFFPCFFLPFGASYFGKLPRSIKKGGNEILLLQRD